MSPHLFRNGHRVLMLLALLLAVGCDEPATAPSNPGSIALIIVSGNGQSGVVGRELPLPLVVKATNPNGSVIANLTVEFRVTSGYGSMYVVATSTTTKGLAQNYWTLGTSTADPQTVEVRAIVNGSKQVLGTFTATPLAGPATSVQHVAGDGQFVYKETSAPIAPAVVVSDQYGNPVPNLSVTFLVTSGGGSVTGAIQPTNPAGVATVGSWIVGPTSGQNTLTATAAGSGISGNPVTFHATAGDWVTKTSMPTPRFGVGAGVVNGVLYAVGGYNYNSGYLGIVEAYDPATDSWSARAAMPTPRYAMGVGVVNGVLYAVGGSNNSGHLGTVEAYDPATDSWSTKASMPTPRDAMGVGVVNGVLYAVGGFGNSGPLGTVEAYDPATDNWSTGASMPAPRYFVGVGVVNGVLYAVGGYGNSGPLGTVEAYDPATDSWSTKAWMPTPRRGVGAGVVNGVLYAVGGYDSNSHLGTVEAYDPATDSWSTGESMLAPRHLMGVGVINGVLYAVGGDDNSGVLGTVEAFVP